jgi:hypothetical protein
MELRMDRATESDAGTTVWRRRVRIAFWAGFGGWTLLLVVLATLNLGRTDAIGLLIQCLALLALVAIALTGFRLQLATAIALITVAMPWAGFAWQFWRRVSWWLHRGGEAPDGFGSPLAFVLGWLTEAACGLLPLSVLLVFGCLSLLARKIDRDAIG